MKTPIKKYVWLIPVFAFFLACSPEYDATIEEMDLAITRYDKDQNFTGYNTFYLEDTVVYIVENEDDLEDIDRTHDAQIISKVRENLLDMGWTEVTNPDDLQSDADVSILLSALAVDMYYYYTYWWDYWDWWYWGGWYPGYYPWYPVYPGIGYPSYGYTVGTVMIDMLDLQNIQIPTNQEDRPEVDIIWTGAVNGILAGSDASISNRLAKGIDQVFNQSPYLEK
jgi:hypothetical protein